MDIESLVPGESKVEHVDNSKAWTYVGRTDDGSVVVHSGDDIQSVSPTAFQMFWNDSIEGKSVTLFTDLYEVEKLLSDVNLTFLEVNKEANELDNYALTITINKLQTQENTDEKAAKNS